MLESGDLTVSRVTMLEGLILVEKVIVSSGCGWRGRRGLRRELKRLGMGEMFDYRTSCLAAMSCFQLTVAFGLADLLRCWFG